MTMWDKTSRRNEENMQEQGDKELFVKQLKEMLDWYTFQATEEEYSEGNVEHILNLLDSFEPIGEEELPQRGAAWERFRQMAGEKLSARAAQGDDASVSGRAKAGGGVPLESDGHEIGSSALGRRETTEGELLERTAQEPDSPSRRRSLTRFGGFVARHKYIAAAVLVLLILAVSGTAHAIATQGSDFFFWMKRDETGTKMMVSPEGLDGVTEQKNVYYYEDSEELPDWAQEWAQIADKVEMPEGYEFQYFEVNEFENFEEVVGHYRNLVINQEMLLGAWPYYGKVSYNSEDFVRYSYVQSYEIDQKKLDIFDKSEENGDIFYAICFYDGNCRYWVIGQDDLDEVKQLAEWYLYCVQGNM